MKHPVEAIIPSLEHTTSKGQKFELCLKKKNLSEKHDYWLYIIETKHESWGNKAFSAFVTKSSYPNEELADSLAKSIIVDTVKQRLEEATHEGLPLYFPVSHEGFAII